MKKAYIGLGCGRKQLIYVWLQNASFSAIQAFIKAEKCAIISFRSLARRGVSRMPKFCPEYLKISLIVQVGIRLNVGFDENVSSQIDSKQTLTCVPALVVLENARLNVKWWHIS